MKERIVSLGILLFALLYTAGAVALKVGTLAQPGAGQFPAVIAVALLAVAGVQVWRTFRAPASGGEGHRWLQLAPAGIAVSLVAYPLLLKTFSFLIATFIVLVILFRLLRLGNTLVSVLTALGTTLLSFVVFTGVLGVVVPSDYLEPLILKITGLG